MSGAAALGMLLEVGPGLCVVSMYFCGLFLCLQMCYTHATLAQCMGQPVRCHQFWKILGTVGVVSVGKLLTDLPRTQIDIWMDFCLVKNGPDRGRIDERWEMMENDGE